MHRLPRFLLLLVLAGCANDASLSASVQNQEYRYRQTGSGGPVVVFENGLGITLETWESVQEGLGGSTTTFAYNRAGYAGSPRTSGIRDAATVVGELRALLGHRGLSPPYLLVGHSFGGLYMQYYARNFPDEVAGLVLVDSTHWDLFERMRRAGPAAAHAADRRPLLIWGVRRAEFDAFEVVQREVRESPPLRSMPLTVLSAGRIPGGSPITLEFWHELQRELAAQLPDAQHTIVERSAHVIQQEQPEFVWKALSDMIVALRAQ